MKPVVQALPHEFGESCFYYMIGQYDKRFFPDFKELTPDGGFMDPKEEAVVKFYEEIPNVFQYLQKQCFCRSIIKLDYALLLIFYFIMMLN